MRGGFLQGGLPLLLLLLLLLLGVSLLVLSVDAGDYSAHGVQPKLRRVVRVIRRPVVKRVIKRVLIPTLSAKPRFKQHVVPAPAAPVRTRIIRRVIYRRKAQPKMRANIHAVRFKAQANHKAKAKAKAKLKTHAKSVVRFKAQRTAAHAKAEHKLEVATKLLSQLASMLKVKSAAQAEELQQGASDSATAGDDENGQGEEDTGPIYILPLAPMAWSTLPQTPFPTNEQGGNAVTGEQAAPFPPGAAQGAQAQFLELQAEIPPLTLPTNRVRRRQKSRTTRMPRSGFS